MSHRIPVDRYPRAITLALGPVTATLPDGSDSSSTAAPSSSTSSKSSSSKSSKSSKPSKSTKTGKSSTTLETSTSSSIASSTSSSTTSSTSSSITSTTASITSTSTTSQSAAAATTSAAVSSTHAGGTSPGLVAFAVIASLLFAGAIIYVIIMRRHHKQREWTFQQHQRIFERFDKSKDPEIRPNTSHTMDTANHPPMPAAVPDDNGKAWQAGTGASVITTGPSVIRKLDWDKGPERRPKSMIEAAPKRKPVPPPKEAKKKRFSQYLPYLLPQNHSAEVIELGKAQQQVYQRPTYKPAG